jgi:hypothetical protein
MSTELIELWHKRAHPEPTDDDFNVQLVDTTSRR